MKKIRGFFIVLICIVLLNGCVKNTNTMTINKDKSLLFESDIIYSNIIDKEKIDDSFIKEYEKLGLKITDSKEEGYSGYKISRSFKNIDEVSSGTSNKIKMDDILKKDVKDLKIFKHEKGFLKDTYTANIEFEYTEDMKSKYDITSTNSSASDTNNEENEEDEEVEEDMSMLNKIAEISSEMEFKYIVKLPYASIKNNATESNNNDKTLIWEIETEPGKTTIDYSFCIYNITNIIIVSIAVLIALIAIIVTVLIIKKKKSGEETLIHKDFDPSIADKVGEVVEEEKAEDIIPQPEYSANLLNQNESHL